MKVKSLMLLLLVVILSVSICACSKVKEKIAEKGMEALLENATGADVDLSKDGIAVEVGGEKIEVGENLKWPEEAMGGLPEPNAKITFVNAGSAGEGGSVNVEGFELDDAKKYMEQIKSMGYICESNETPGEIMFSGKIDKVGMVTLMYSIEKKEGMIVYSPYKESENMGQSSE